MMARIVSVNPPLANQLVETFGNLAGNSSDDGAVQGIRHMCTWVKERGVDIRRTSGCCGILARDPGAKKMALSTLAMGLIGTISEVASPPYRCFAATVEVRQH
jgi:hypothetical protein